MPPFFDRTDPLRLLEERYRSGRSELLVFYGRRRIGKSALLREFCRDKPAVYYVAARVREPQSLEAFQDVLRASFPDPLLPFTRFSGWEEAWHAVLHLAGGGRLVLILDEFQDLCQENPALPSLLQRFWDQHGQPSQLMLILCGSHIGFMEQEVLAERSPLFGRRTGQLRLGPLTPWDAARFFPTWSLPDKLRAFGALGGVPAYLERLDPARPLRENLLRELFTPSGYLFDEVAFLLRTELGQSHTYMSLLQAIAGGSTRVSEIAPKAGLSVTSVMRPLNVFADLGFIRREIPFDEKHPEHSKRGLYTIADPFIAFWCRYVLPHQSLLTAGRASLVLERMIEPDLPVYLGGVFEHICRDYVIHRGADLLGGEHALRVGRLWGPGYELDLVAELTDGTILVGECKAWSGPVGHNVLTELRERAVRAPRGKRQRLLLCGLQGFTEQVQALARAGEVLLLRGEELFAF